MTRPRDVAAAKLAFGLALVLGLTPRAPNASAQIARPPRSPIPAPQPPQPTQAAAHSPETDTSRSLRGRFGLDAAVRLLASSSLDDRLRGIARAAAIGSPEAVALLARTATTGEIRADARALLDLTRALAMFVDQGPARSALAAILTAPPVLPPAPRQGPRGPREIPDDAEQAARALMARKVAAIALGETSFKPGLDPLVSAARVAGPAQVAAVFALALTRPSDMPQLATGPLSPPLLRLFGEVGDLRVVDAVRGATHSPDAQTRAAALLALADFRDSRAVEIARGFVGDTDPRVRVAATEALVALDAADAGRAVEALLLAQDGTALAGARLAERTQSDGVVKALAARAVASSDAEMRAAAVVALGHQTSDDALTALKELAVDPMLAADVVSALGRSPNAGTRGVLEAMVATPGGRTLALRAYVIRALVRGERSAVLDRAAVDLATSRQPRDRPLGVFVRVALGALPVVTALADSDARVRRAAAMAARALDGADTPALLARFAVEPDALTRAVLAPALEGAVARTLGPRELDGVVTTRLLVERIEAGGPDAPLAAFALAARVDDETRPRVAALFASRDAVVRAHVARGLGKSHAPDAIGRLAAAYRYEVDVNVRRAVVAALADRVGDRAPERIATLKLAAHFDSDRTTREAASRVVEGRPPANPRLGPMEVALVRVGTVDGEGRLPPLAGSLLGSDGFANPIVFDDDGFALAPRTPPGEARLILAPRLTSYEAPAP